MEPIIVNRSLVDKNRSAENRKRFLARYKTVLREWIQGEGAFSASNDVINTQDIGTAINLNETIDEPSFRYGSAGDDNYCFSGNDYFVQKDTFKTAEDGDPDDSDDSDDEGEGNGGASDDFRFKLTEEEFSNIMFDGCTLPNFIKKRTKAGEEFTLARAGYGHDGPVSSLSLIRSFIESIKRKIITNSAIKQAIEKITNDTDLSEPDKLQQINIKKKKKIPYIDDLDLRYHIKVKQPKPISSAVLFCVLDVSGSMRPSDKRKAKRLFFLMNLFLRTKYKNSEVVFIRHTDVAEEIDEYTFFNETQTGGTGFLHPFQLINNIIDERYNPDDYNIYIAHVSDGDCFDGTEAMAFLKTELIRKAQLFIYAEIYSYFWKTNNSQWLNDLEDNFKNNQINQLKTLIITDFHSVLDGFFSIFKPNEKTL